MNYGGTVLFEASSVMYWRDSYILCRVIIDADAPYIKMVSEQFDRCHGTLLQYVEFLCSAVTPTSAYAQLIPSLDDLVHQYHLDPEVSLSLSPPIKCFEYLVILIIFFHLYLITAPNL